ncbi:MAG: gamma carbonic anhydrase family protein [Candidatus Obscuribacterales bacterium]|nr:gamma carbonic anhydrase family protein [Candidatus Obscuribacterales bacterium]
MISAFKGRAPRISPSAFVAPDATVIGRVELADESSLWFQSVVRGDINEIRIGTQTNIQDGSLLHVTRRHPVIIGNRVTVGHGVIIHGCDIGDDCLIAMGAIVLDGAVIDPGCIIGAGTLIPPDMRVPAGSLVLGSPGKVVRQLTEQDLRRIESGWRNYVEYRREYMEEFKP